MRTRLDDSEEENHIHGKQATPSQSWLQRLSMESIDHYRSCGISMAATGPSQPQYSRLPSTAIICDIPHRMLSKGSHRPRSLPQGQVTLQHPFSVYANHSQVNSATTPARDHHLHTNPRSSTQLPPYLTPVPNFSMKLLTTLVPLAGLVIEGTLAATGPLPPVGQAACTITPDAFTKRAHYELIVLTDSVQGRGCKAFTDLAPTEIMTNIVDCSPLGDHAIRLNLEAGYDVETLHAIVGALGAAFPPSGK